MINLVFLSLFSLINIQPGKAAQVSNKEIDQFCTKVDKSFLGWGWGLSGCKNFSWESWRKSVKGDPLMWATFGPTDETIPMNTTLIMCTVHGDEITPTKFCFDILHDLKDRYQKDFKDFRVLVAPIVNPDSFFITRPTRTNANGVDVNRNFPTADFDKNALSLWINRFKKDPRRYPGKIANSEPETIFQVNLIKRYMPSKIISIHAPLTLLDYDGPGDEQEKNGIPQGANAHEAKELLVQMSEDANRYKIKNYPYFPGSLGNWAGKGLGIPVYTIELPDSDARKSAKYWDLFKKSIETAIRRDFGQGPPPPTPTP